MSTYYQDIHPFLFRLGESTRIRTKYPDRILVLIQRKANSKAPFIEKQKYLVGSDMTVAQLLYSLRKKVKIDPSQALFFFIHEHIPISSSSMQQVYHEHKSSDGFLYMTYDIENTFG